MSPSTALIVIDAQESFRHRPYFRPTALDGFLERQQALVDGARAAGWPIIQVFHVEESGPFSLASGHVQTLAGLEIAPDWILRKHRHSAFVGTGLDLWLGGRAIQRLLISGIRTEQCCETTARHASDLGYAVDFVSEATLTFPMTDRNGRLWSPDEIRERTELVLDRRFARIVTVDEALCPIPEKQAA